SSLTFLIESSPTNLDPRFATDSQSQRLDGLLFNGLLARDNQMNFHGDLRNPGKLRIRPRIFSISDAAFASTMAVRSLPPTCRARSSLSLILQTNRPSAARFGC